jgi:hypothetical protein
LIFPPIGVERRSRRAITAVDRHLAGDDQRAGAVAIVDDLQQIALLFGEQRFRPPVTQDHQIDPSELLQRLGVAIATTARASAANSRGIR